MSIGNLGVTGVSIAREMIRVHADNMARHTNNNNNNNTRAPFTITPDIRSSREMTREMTNASFLSINNSNEMTTDKLTK